MRRVGIRVANVCLFVLACFLLASIVNQFAAAGLAVTPQAVAPVALSAPIPKASWNDRTAILDRNLFGSRPEPDVVVEVVEPVEVLEETRLPLLLLGTAATDDPTTARAAISNKSRNRHEVVMVGDHLQSHPEVHVILIERRRVILQNGPRREELTLEDRKLAVKRNVPVTRPPPARAAARLPRNRTATRQRNDNVVDPVPRNVLAENLQRLAEEAKLGEPPAGVIDFLSQATVKPEYEGRQMVGVSVFAIEPGSALEKMGLKEGDRVSNINGVKLDDPSALSKITAAIAQAKEISVIVNGKPLIVKTDQLAEFQP